MPSSTEMDQSVYDDEIERYYNQKLTAITGFHIPSDELDLDSEDFGDGHPQSSQSAVLLSEAGDFDEEFDGGIAAFGEGDDVFIEADFPVLFLFFFSLIW